MAIFTQFTLSSIAASITHLAFFAITAILDRVINSEIANIIGLLVDLTLDFFVQQYVFMKKIDLDSKIITKYLGSSIITLFIDQMLFMLYYRTIYKEGHNLTIARVIISVTIYIFIVFPIRKFFIYRE